MKISGLPVRDAKSNLKVSITARDIRFGSTKDPSSCAAARACKRMDGVTDAIVHTAVTYVRMGDKAWIRYHTPSSMRNEIIAFDRGGNFEAGEYEFRPVRHSHKLGTRQGSATKAKTKANRGKSTRARPQLIKGIRSSHIRGYSQG